VFGVRKHSRPILCVFGNDSSVRLHSVRRSCFINVKLSAKTLTEVSG